MPVIAKQADTTASLDHPSAKDFDLLRKTDDVLEKQISKLSFTRLALVVILIFMFASALHRRNEGAIQDTLEALSSMSANSGHNLKLDPISVYAFPPDWNTKDGSFQARLGNLKAQYNEVFTVKFSALGTDLSFDLRLIIVSFPLWLPLAQVYISIVREKRRLIRFIGRTLMKQIAPDKAMAVDLLLFGPGEGPYQAYPGILVDVLFWSMIVVLLSIMLWITDMRATDDAPIFLKLALVVVLTSAFYASAFSSFVSTRLRQQVKALLGTSVPLDTFGRIWHTLNQSVISLPARVKPRLPLLSSSILILLTMALQTGQVGCNKSGSTGEPRAGYKLLVGSADWPPSLDPVFLEADTPQNLIGRACYGLSLLLALAGLILVGLISIGKAFSGGFLLIAGRICAAMSIVFFCQFANPVLPFWTLKWLSFLPLALTIVLLILAKLATRRSLQWSDRIYRGLQMGYVPLVVADLVYLVSIAGMLPGLLMLFFSIPVMTLGYLSARRMVAEMQERIVASGTG